MPIPFQKWMKDNKNDIDELFSIFIRYFPDCKMVYRQFCILIYNKTDEQIKNQRM